MNATAKRLTLALAVILCVASCASERRARRLDPASREFYSKVRYIITAEERKAFLALPEADRPAFIEDFWERRDPQPTTEENEFKAEYFKRIETANRLFSGGAAPGWLQDRGRVYITLGPPDYREAYPRGITFYGLPTEIWWYGLVSIVFIDQYWNDDYKISPDSAGQIAAITQAQTEWNKPLVGLPRPGEAGFTAGIAGLDVTIAVADGPSARFALSLPYKNIWLKSAGQSLQATLEVTLKVAGPDGTEAWSFAQSYPIDIPQSRLKDVLDTDFKVEAVASLKPGAYSLSVVVVNKTDGSRTALERKFEI